MNKLLFIILMFIVLLGFTGSAAAFVPIVRVGQTKNGHTLLLYSTKNGIEIDVNVAKNGTIVERYKQIVRQIKGAGKDNYISFYRSGLPDLILDLQPRKNKVIFSVLKKFNDDAYGAIYTQTRGKKVNIYITKVFQGGKFKLLRTLTNPKLQDLFFKFNYPQPRPSQNYSKLMSFVKIPGKSRNLIEFHAVDGLTYIILANLNNKFNQIFLIKDIKHLLKSGKNLFGVRLTKKYTQIDLFPPQSRGDKAVLVATVFLYKNNSNPVIHIAKYKKVDIYYKFKNFK